MSTKKINSKQSGGLFNSPAFSNVQRIVKGADAWINNNAYDRDADYFEFKPLSGQYEPRYDIGGLKIYVVPGSDIEQYIDPEKDSGPWGGKNFDPNSNYYLVQNKLGGGSYSTIPQNGYISALIDMYNNSDREKLDTQMEQMRQAYLNDVEVRAQQTRDNYINWMIDQGYSPIEVLQNTPGIDYYRWINDGIGNVEELREKYPNNMLLNQPYIPYANQGEFLDADKQRIRQTQINAMQNSAASIGSGYTNPAFFQNMTPDQVNNGMSTYGTAQATSFLLGPTMGIGTGGSSLRTLGSSLYNGATRGFQTAVRAVSPSTYIEPLATTLFRVTPGTARIAGMYGDAALASYMGGTAFGNFITNPSLETGIEAGVGLLPAGLTAYNTLRSIPLSYYTSYLRHPNWRTYYHASRTPFDVNEYKLTGIDLGMHVNDNLNAAQAFPRRYIYKIRAPRPSAETIDIWSNDWRLLKNNYLEKAHPSSDPRNYIGSNKSDILRFNMLQDAGANPSWGTRDINRLTGNKTITVINTENPATLNLRSRFPKLDNKVADNIVNQGDQLLSRFSYSDPRDFADDPYYKLFVKPINEAAQKALSNAGYNVVKYANVGELNDYTDFSYFITNPSIIDPLPLKINWNLNLPRWSKTPLLLPNTILRQSQDNQSK